MSQSRPGVARKPRVRRTVLVVEDEVLIRMDVAEALRLAGLRVIEASSADEALRLLDQGHEVDVIFSDINMPGELDGLDLHKVATVRFPNVKLILTSARPLPEGAPTRGIRFIAKPYPIQTVLRAIEDEPGTDDA